MRSLVAALLVSFVLLADAPQEGQARQSWKFQTKTPKWVRKEFGAHHMEKEYALTYQIYPSYIEGDFNGDGRNDVAVLVQQKSTGKMGVAIFHGRRPQAIYMTITVLGAGKELAGAGDNFRWANMWKRIPSDSDSLKGMSLTGDAIQMEKRDSTRGLIWWHGGSYEWAKRKN